MITFEKIIPILKSSKNIAIFSHINTDGDAIGSSLGLKIALESIGKIVDVFSDSDIPDMLNFLPELSTINKKSVRNYDLSIALDSTDSQRLGRYEKEFLESSNTIQIDHHMGNDSYAKVNYVDPEASSTCFLIVMLLNEMNINISKEASIAFLTGIITDTGGFRFSNTDTRTLRTVVDLVENSGIDLSDINKKIFESYDKKYFEIYKIAMNNTKFYEKDQISITVLRNIDYQKVGIDERDVKNITRIGTELRDVKVAVSMSEANENEYHISFRSSGEVDVRLAASIFGGGGHKSASGCRIYGNFETAYEKLLKSVTDII